jgi:hypothetical protein
VQHHTADELDVEMAQPDCPNGALPNNGERFKQDIVERLSIAKSTPELIRLSSQLLIAERVHGRLELVDRFDKRLIALDFTADGVSTYDSR